MSILDDVASPAPTPPTARARRPRRTALLAAGAVGVVAVAGAGAWAWQEWFAQGPQAAEALPADTLAYVGLDLDPPGGQKLAAYNALRRIPSLSKTLGLSSQDDLRRAVVDGVVAEGGCDLDYGDVADWAGDRAALAIVPQKRPEPVAVVQAGDAGAARATLEKALAGECRDEFGFAETDGWIVLARTDAVARRVVSDSRKARLAEDRTFRDLTGAAGDPGILTLYASPESGSALLDSKDGLPFFALLSFGAFGQVDPVGSLLTAASFAQLEMEATPDEAEANSDEAESFTPPPMTPEEEDSFLAEMPEPGAGPDAELQELDDQLEDDFEDDFDDEFDDEFDDMTFASFLPDPVRKQLESFAGLGGVARFEDGALELEVVAAPALPLSPTRYDGAEALTAVEDLPADVALAFGGGLADGWADAAVQESSPFGFFEDEASPDAAKEFEKATGLTAAELAALGGERVAFAARHGFADKIESGDPDDVPVAARITGDPEAIERSLADVRAAMGTRTAGFLASKPVDGALLVGPSAAFLDELAAPGPRLGDDDRFRRAVPDAENATSLTYADFDAGDWLVAASEGELDAADIAPLDTAGLSLTHDGDRQRLLLRVTFDE